VTDDLGELRREVAAVHGLPSSAASLLTGSTLTELEQSAARLAELVASSREQAPEQADPLTLALAAGPAEKARRQRRLVEALHPRPGHPRDERGRFETRGFGGGARQQPWPSKPPEVEHNELVSEMARLSRTFGTILRTGF
jgi:hypothetical protein